MLQPPGVVSECVCVRLEGVRGVCVCVCVCVCVVYVCVCVTYVYRVCAFGGLAVSVCGHILRLL